MKTTGVDRWIGFTGSAVAGELAAAISQRQAAAPAPRCNDVAVDPAVIGYCDFDERIDQSAWSAEFRRLEGSPGRLCLVVTGAAFRGYGRKWRRLERLLSGIPKEWQRRTLVLLTGSLEGGDSRVSRLPVPDWMLPLLPESLSFPVVSVDFLAEVICEEFLAGRETGIRAGAVRGTRRLVIPGPRKSVGELRGALKQRAGWRGSCGRAVEMMGKGGFRVLLGMFWPVVSGILGLPAAVGQVTVRPRSARELLEAYHRWSIGDVQLAGWNNGVVHFGWRFPGRTVVSTASSGRCLRVGRETVTADAGLPLKQVLARLHSTGRTLPVVPNFSWISVGTAFFVPVHGSGQRISTLGAAIQSALLYDARAGRFVRVHRGDALFRTLMYDRTRSLLLLRLTFRISDLTAFSCREEHLQRPTADELLQSFADGRAANVEIRKARAADEVVTVRKYDAVGAAVTGGELPRDRLGSLWDRIEETPLLGRLFHWFVRRFAFHVELLMTVTEFRVFWQEHSRLPLSKIQLRRMLRDEIENSACRDQDCICADLFMMRGKRDVFTQFVAQYLPGVRTNPGKQSL